MTEVITDLFGTITALVSGDWGGAVTGGITTVLDFMGTEFGRLLMSKGMNALLGLPKAFSALAQGGGTLKGMGQVVKVTGVTVHFANEIYDNGPIIAQRALAVGEGWDVDTLEEHIHAIEHVLYPEVAQMLADGRVHVLESGKVAIDAPRR